MYIYGERIWMPGRFTVKGCGSVGHQKVVEAKNGIAEQIESDNFTLALLTFASHTTSHVSLRVAVTTCLMIACI